MCWGADFGKWHSRWIQAPLLRNQQLPGTLQEFLWNLTSKLIHAHLDFASIPSIDSLFKLSQLAHIEHN
jgi:hypothetical protein